MGGKEVKCVRSTGTARTRCGAEAGKKTRLGNDRRTLRSCNSQPGNAQGCAVADALGQADNVKGTI